MAAPPPPPPQQGGPSVDHKREPCPDRILDDVGGAFGMGAVGGGIWHALKGAKNSPGGARLRGSFEVRARVVVVGERERERDDAEGVFFFLPSTRSAASTSKEDVLLCPSVHSFSSLCSPFFSVAFDPRSRV